MDTRTYFKKMRPKRLSPPLGLVALVLSGVAATATMAAKPALGVQNGQLAPCPDSPNCVSTQAPPDDGQHYAPLIPFTGDAKKAMRAVSEAVEATPRSKVVTKDKRYLHAEVRSLVFRFTDDVEFYIDNTAKLIHFRSASRVGKGDMGVNRKRMDKLRGIIEAKLANS